MRYTEKLAQPKKEEKPAPAREMTKPGSYTAESLRGVKDRPMKGGSPHG